MESQTLTIRASRQLAAVSYHRVFSSHFKVMWFSTALFCVLLCLAGCGSSMDDLQTSENYDACGSYRSNHDSGFQDAFGSDDNLDITSGKSTPQLKLGKVCAISNLFCFPSTLPGYFAEEQTADKSVLEASGVSSDDTLAGGSLQSRNNLNWSQNYDGGVYKLMSGRVVSCSLNFQDSISDISSCQKSSSKQNGNSEKIKTTTLDDSSVPHVEISPPLLDWGQNYLYSPSLSFITVANTHNDTFLNVYEPYSTNSQFYPCNRSELTLKPGEIAAICFVFLPTFLGMSSSKLILQTSSGGFLIQASGFAVENPYGIKPLTSLEFSSNGRLTKNLSLFNPFDDTVYVEEVNAWISFSADNTSHSTKATCRSVDNVDGSANPSVPAVKEWSYVGQSTIAMRPHGSFEVGPQRTETLMEIDFPNHCQGRITGAFCMQLQRSSKEIVDIVMVPIEAEIAGFVSVYIETLVTSSDRKTSIVGLSLRNPGPYLLTVVKITGIGEGIENFQIKYMEGLILFDKSVTQVATVTYTPIETRIHECRLIVSTNDSSNPQIEIPCDDIVNARKMMSSSEIKTEADELVLGNWRSQAKATGGTTVLDDREIFFPMVEIGTHRSKWIAVRNPGRQPIVMQLVLNSGEIVDECRDEDGLLEHSWSSSVVRREHATPLKYGFSTGDRSVTEAYVHPNGRALLGPVFFHPSSRCAWKSSALIRNNLTGVEWVPLRGFGGSVSLALFEGIDPLQNIEFFSENSSMYHSCSQPLFRELYAKNVGDLQLEVNRLQVSGTECGLDGFVVENCNGFALEPGESTKIRISYQNDYSSAIVQRDLELALLTGFLVIPMKASIPTPMLATCRKSVAWTKVKKSSVAILLVGSVIYLVFCYILPQAISGDSSTHFNPKMNGFLKSIEEDETSITDSVKLIENRDAQSPLPPPANLTVKIGKEKGRRRRKKKGSQLEVSSSQSGNSTPSSPLDSPTTSLTTPKRFLQESLTVDQDSRDPFTHVHTEKNLASKPKTEPKVSMKYVEQKTTVPKATFPCTIRPPSSTYLTLKSTIAPHARAPGSKLNYVKNEGGGQKDEYRYDIWGEHIFGFRSKEVFAKSPLAIECNSDSLFVRGPQSLVTVSKLKSVAPHQESG